MKSLTLYLEGRYETNYEACGCGCVGRGGKRQPGGRGGDTRRRRDYLAIGFVPNGTTVVPGVAVTVTVKYACLDTAGTETVPIEVTLDQNGNGGHSGTTNAPCQVTNGTRTVTVPFLGVQADVEIDANANIDDYSDGERFCCKNFM